MVVSRPRPELALTTTNQPTGPPAILVDLCRRGRSHRGLIRIAVRASAEAPRLLPGLAVDVGGHLDRVTAVRLQRAAGDEADRVVLEALLNRPFRAAQPEADGLLLQQQLCLHRTDPRPGWEHQGDGE